MDVSINTSELRRLERSMRKAGKSYERASAVFLKEFGRRVWIKARALCPISPQKQQSARQNKSGVSRRNPKYVTPGQLTNSIQMDAQKDRVSIFVPSNSPGGAYAKKIHDERGKTWKNLGPASIAKGATDEFIFKAYDAEQKLQGELVDALIAKFTESIGI